MLHLRTKNLKKNFKNFKEFVKILSVNFSATFLSWSKSQEESHSLNYILSSYNCFRLYRPYRRGRDVCLFLKESFCCKPREDFSINYDAIQSLCQEITIENRKI